MSTLEIKDGDIFRWRYADEKPEQLGQWGRYHCRSRIAVAKDGWLIDTFWTYGVEKPRRDDSTASWSCDDAKKKLELTFVGNIGDLEKRDEWQAAYYDDADIVNLNHGNSSRGNFYVRKDAQRCRSKMLATVAERIAECERIISFEQSKLERLRETTARLNSSESLDKIYL